MNEGARRLSSLGMTLRTVADEVGVTIQLVSYWINSKRIPGPEKRDKIYALWGIQQNLWEEPARKPEIRPETTIKNVDKLGIVERLNEQLARYNAVSQDPDLTHHHRMRLEGNITKTLQLIAQYTGEGLEMSEAQIAASPHFKRMAARVVEATTPWPEAEAAVIRALRAADE